MSVYACWGSYSYSCFGIVNWIACTMDYVYGQFVNGQYWTGPHLFFVEADFKSNPVDINGNPESWWANLEDYATCHEMAGHGYGGSHTGSGSSGNPAQNASCLTPTYLEGTTPLTLGTAVRTDEGSWASSNDNSSDGFWNTAYTKPAGKIIRRIAAAHLNRRILAAAPWLYAQLGIAAKPILLTEAALHAKKTPAPLGYFYIVRGAGEAMTLSSSSKARPARASGRTRGTRHAVRAR